MAPLRSLGTHAVRRARFRTDSSSRAARLTARAGRAQPAAGNPFAEGGALAWEAHLGGFLAGLAAMAVLERRAGPGPRAG